MSNLEMRFEPTLYDQGDEMNNLLDIVNRFQEGDIQLPQHQRGQVWGPSKKEGWVNRIAGRLHANSGINVKPVGVILTYQLTSGHTVFLNDGYQRISATIDYLENAERYGDTKDEAQRVVRACRLPIQHRHYETHDDAVVDFQLLNLGTSLTAYEFFKGILAYTEGYNRTWKPLLDELHQTIDRNAQKIVDKSKVRPETLHKYYRHNYSLLYRFLIKDKRMTNYRIGAKTVTDFSEVQNRKAIEWLLRDQLLGLGADKARKQLTVFQKLIERETMLFCEVWFKERPQASGITNTLYRWLLDCAIWKRNNGKSAKTWETFLKLLFDHNEGGTQVPDPNNQRNKNTLELSGLGKLGRVCEVIGSDLYEPKTRGRKGKLRARAGADQSHITTDGDDVFPESAIRNRSRGAKDIDEEDLPNPRLFE